MDRGGTEDERLATERNRGEMQEDQKRHAEAEEDE
jgi:hypothetical protein